MSQQQRYRAHFILWDDSKKRCDIVPPLQQPGQINEFCIGYMRAVVPGGVISQSGGQAPSLYYTGHPCHKTHVVLLQPQQTGQPQSVISVTSDMPVVEIIACFMKQQGKWQHKSIPSNFEVIFDGISLSWAHKIKVQRQDCNVGDLLNQYQLTIDDSVKRYLPSSIYYATQHP
jgi:hypothetical protein